MYPVRNINRLRILSTRYIRVIFTTNNIINRLVLVLRKCCVLSFCTLKSPLAFKGCAMIQAFCRRPVTTKTWFRLCPWDSVEHTGTGTDFFEPLGFPLSVSIHKCCILIFWSEGEAVGDLTDQCCLWHPAALQQCVIPASLAARQPPYPPAFVRRVDLCLPRRLLFFVSFFWGGGG